VTSRYDVIAASLESLSSSPLQLGDVTADLPATRRRRQRYVVGLRPSNQFIFHDVHVEQNLLQVNAWS